MIYKRADSRISRKNKPERDRSSSRPYQIQRTGSFRRTINNNQTLIGGKQTKVVPPEAWNNGMEILTGNSSWLLNRNIESKNKLVSASQSEMALITERRSSGWKENILSRQSQYEASAMNEHWIERIERKGRR